VLIVDRSLPAAEGRVVVAVVNSELTVKRLCQQDGILVLAPANPAYPVIVPAPDADVTIWGVVVYVIHRV